jgi:predicted patatin/cPLA2 family phospholipase
MIYGNTDVLKILLRKSKGERLPNRTTLILDGGGMRGIFGMGACRGLEYLGLTSVFDDVVGVSAGAANGAFFIAQQAALACTVYTDDLTDKRFVNYWRLKKIVDIDYLADHVLRFVKRIDVQQIRASNIELWVAVTQMKTGRGELLKAKAYPDIIRCLKASMAMPILYNIPVTLGNKYYLDGLNSLDVPIKAAIEKLHPTDMLVILNRPLNYRKAKWHRQLNWLTGKLMLRSVPKEYFTTFVNTDVNFNKSVDVNEFMDGSIRIAVITPNNEIIKRTTQDRNALIKAANEAEKEVIKVFTDLQFVNTKEER